VGNAYQSGSAYPVKVDDLEDAIALSAGDNYTCAVEGTDGYCWGSGQAGQLGNGNNQMEGTPASVFSGALKVVAGNWHTCAITLQGQISCWGANVYGQIGNGTTTDSNSPVPVSLGWTAVDVTARWNHSCAAHQDGTVYCWGWNRYGQLGRGDLLDQLSPKPASGTILNEVVVQVAAGMHHTCALDQDGGVWCWGRNNYGQIGDPYAQQDQCGSDVECVLEPHRVPYQPSGVVSSIAVGHDHTCALSQDTMYCWGKNWHGQLGDGQGGPGAEEKQPKPVTQNNPAFVSITAGGEHTCAIDGEGKAYCWGQNEQDQVGGTADATQLVPFAVPDPSP
jgi:alpha-tubulin suppressor-like RCC1 family protein